MSEAAIKTTCPYCGVGCGVVAAPNGEGGITVAGDPDHPANEGRLCSKGAALAETLSLRGRLLQPHIDGERASWDAALDLVATRLREVIAKHGPDSVAFYVSGQLLTEDYYLANKLMKGYIGSANIDTNSRLCMASSVAGHKRAFGSDTVPGCYEDLELADLVVLVGSNLAWCHPVLYQRLAEARQKRNTKIVVIDPRVTATCELADLHLAIAPGADVALFNGLLQHLAGSGILDRAFVWRHTTDLLAALKAAEPLTRADIVRATGLSSAAISEFYRLFAAHPRTVTIYSQGVNQSTRGTDKVNAIINCHLATGRIGKPGMAPFSVTGQPNAMGGREVGGLANMLAAHMELADPDHRRIVQDFWRSPRIADKPGLKAVDLFRAVGAGRIKAIWIMATNPVVSMPEANVVRAALAACPFVVVSDVERYTDTTALAHVLLPSLAWGEKDGTVTNSERRISRQRAFLPAPGEARPDWWQLAEVAKLMGWREAFGYASSADIFAEHARLSAAGNEGTRDFDLGRLTSLNVDTYDELAPFQWPQRVAASSHSTSARFFADGRFFTPDSRARFVPTPFREPAAQLSVGDHFVLNTGRIRDQWHTMTRTARTPRLMSHIAEPFVEIHPADASRCGLEPAHLARVRSALGDVIVRVIVTERQRPGSVFIPMHWTDNLASAGRVDALIQGDVDPVSGQPGLKQALVRIEPFNARFHAVAVMRERPTMLAHAYWALAPIKGGWRIELADATAPEDSASYFAATFGLHDSGAADIVAYRDAANNQDRFAAFVGDRLVAALYCAANPVAVSRAWLAEQLATESFAPTGRLRLLAGRAGQGQRDGGPIVCACLEVGRNDITHAVMVQGCGTVDAVSAVTRAGTNCGSCRAEIGRLIDEARIPQAV